MERLGEGFLVAIIVMSILIPLFFFFENMEYERSAQGVCEKTEERNAESVCNQYQMKIKNMGSFCKDDGCLVLICENESYEYDWECWNNTPPEITIDKNPLYND